MMISTKGRYALRVLIDMAEHQKTAISRSRRSPDGRRFRRSTSRASSSSS